MPTINDTYINALLADAAYAEDLASPVDAQQLEELLSGRMTPTLAKFIAENFEIASHIESGDVFGSGFDATVWRGLPGTPYQGRIYVSMQGTQGLQDFLTNVDLALTGDAGRQVVQMVNWWLQITTPVGQMADQIQYVVTDLTSGLEAAPQVPGTGLISAEELARGVEVNGHSLGGYLGAAFVRLMGQHAHVLHTTTFNSAGFAPGFEEVFDDIATAIGTGLGRPFPEPGSALQTNVFASKGINVTTNSFWFEQMGHREAMFIEEGTGIPNHSMYKLTDALALGAAIEKLTSSTSVDAVSQLLDQSSNVAGASLEAALDALRQLVTGAAVTDTPVGDAGASAQPRIAFHENLEPHRESRRPVGLSQTGMV